MKKPPMYKLDTQLLAKRVREKRGNRSLRDVSSELDIGIAVLSRVENEKLPPDYDNLGKICYWLGDNPATYFRIEGAASDDPIVGQLRAAQKVSVETAGAFIEVIRAAYNQVLAQTDEEDKV